MVTLVRWRLRRIHQAPGAALASGAADQQCRCQIERPRFCLLVAAIDPIAMALRRSATTSCAESGSAGPVQTLGTARFISVADATSRPNSKRPNFPAWEL